MTDNHADQPIIDLADEPAQLVQAYVAAFSTGSAKALDRFYEDQGAVVPLPGHPVVGEDRRAADAHLLGLGLPIEARTRHVYVVDDVALMIVDWHIDGTGPDGEEIHYAGTAADVARRGPDGKWRYIINNPFGASK